MEKIKCTIERITFQNPENGYSVLQATIKGYRDEQTLVLQGRADACRYIP